MKHEVITMPTHHNTTRAVFLCDYSVLAVAEGETAIAAAEIAVGRAIDQGRYDDASPIIMRPATNRDRAEWFRLQTNSGRWVDGRPICDPITSRVSRMADGITEIERHLTRKCPTDSARYNRLMASRRIAALYATGGIDAIAQYLSRINAKTFHSLSLKYLQAIGRPGLAAELAARF